MSIGATLAAAGVSFSLPAEAQSQIERPVSITFDIGLITIANNITGRSVTAVCSPDLSTRQRVEALLNVGNNQSELAADPAAAAGVANDTVEDVGRVLTPICGPIVIDQ
jgi:hypothetical protein